MKSEPILALKNGETVESMMYDGARKVVLLGTSEGRILLVKRLGLNAYMAGNRTIYASVTGKSGVEVEATPKNITYGIVNKLLEVTSVQEISKWKAVAVPVGIDSASTSVGTFTTPVLWAGENFGWWGAVSWTQVIPDGCRVAVQVRVADTEDGVGSAEWETFEGEESGTVSRSMDEKGVAGAYAQVRVHLESSSSAAGPQVSALVLPFYARHVSYFFTVKTTLRKGTDIRGGMLVGVTSVPMNTEVKWGVTGSASADWNDYIEVQPGKVFSLPKGFGDRIRVGARMVSYDDERYPVIDEFALTFDSDIDNLVGRDA